MNGIDFEGALAAAGVPLRHVEQDRNVSMYVTDRACGATPQAAVMASRPPFTITHAPGRILVTDVRDEEYRIDL